MENNPKMISFENDVHTPSKKKKHGWMYDMILHAVDKVFYQVYDGEPVVSSKVRRVNSRENILEEEVLFCKNNVCVHDISDQQDYEDFGEKHLPGYLNMKKIFRSDNIISDLMLSWVPNTLLTVGSTEEEEMFSSPDVSDASYSSIASEDQVTYENTPLRSESGNIHDFETPLGDVFSINLIDVKTIKLFYSNVEKDSGQFVICSKENEYKVFHFHNGGLIKLTEIFNLWNGCMGDIDINVDEVGQQIFYVVGNYKETMDEGRLCHPEEGRYKPMNMNRWLSTVNQLGQIEDGFNFRKHVFFGGLSQEVRPDAWKYLLYYYPMQSTFKDRDVAKEQKRKWYENIQEKRLSLKGEEYEAFWKNIQFIVDKDVVRTDRSHPYYAGQDNPNIDKMRNILLNYAYYNPDMGYTQGMSDLVAPLIATLHDENDSFWCFVGLMEFSMFATTPTDKSMDKSLGFLRELLRIMLPEFYMHCLCGDFDLNLLFAHRWLVLCFKREFIFHEVLKIWETCWVRYQTDYFHIFICVAIVGLYGTVCIEKKMDAVEILQYFTDMAMKFDGSAVLVEGRSLLFKFRQLNRVPCSLRGLLSGKGVWDGGITPDIECVSHNKKCCFEFAKSTSNFSLADSGDVDTAVSSEVLPNDNVKYDNDGVSVASVSHKESDIPIVEAVIEARYSGTDDDKTAVVLSCPEDGKCGEDCSVPSVNVHVTNSAINNDGLTIDIPEHEISRYSVDSEELPSPSPDTAIKSSKVNDGGSTSQNIEEDRDRKFSMENVEFEDVILKRVNELTLDEASEPDEEFENAKIY